MHEAYFLAQFRPFSTNWVSFKIHTDLRIVADCVDSF